MKTKNLGMLLLAIYLILVGSAALLRIGFIGEALPFLAIAAGVMIILGK